MELDNPYGKMVVILRLFCEKNISCLVHLHLPKISNQALDTFITRCPLESTSYHKGHVTLDHFNFSFKRFV